jgi:hypothetical protein
VPRAIAPGVYVAVVDANASAATIWKDGEEYPFFDSGPHKLGPVDYLCVTNKYIGAVCRNNDGQSLWINGVEALRSYFTNNAAENDFLTGMAIDDFGKWYLCGNHWYGLESGFYGKSDAFLWTEESKETVLPVMGQVFCESVSVDNFFNNQGSMVRVFLCGRADYYPVVWKNGSAMRLPYGQAFPGSNLWLGAWARAVYMAGGDEFVVGDVTEDDAYQPNPKSKVMLWKNGEPLRVLEGTGCDIVKAFSVRVVNGDVYVIGSESGYVGGVGVAQWLLWKNDEPPIIIGPNLINPMIIFADAVPKPKPYFVSGGGHVYSVGGAGGLSVMRNGERLFDVKGLLITNIAVLEAPAN